MVKQSSGKIVVDKGIKLPERNGTPINKGSSKYPFKEMDIGDSFFAPITVDAISTTVQRARKVTGFHFALRTVKGGMRCWRVQPESQEEISTSPKLIDNPVNAMGMVEKASPVVATIPKAKAKYDYPNSKYPFEEMEIGESFYAPVRRDVVKSSARYWAARLKAEFRVEHEGKGARCYRVL